MVGNILKKFKVGDTVTIRSYQKIKKGLDRHNEHVVDDLYFEKDDMGAYCGLKIILREKHRSKIWLADNGWYWHEDWLEPFLDDFLTDKDFDI